MANETIEPKEKKGMGTGLKIFLGCLGLLIVIGLCIGGASVLGIMGLGKVANDVSKDIDEEKTAESDAFDNPKAINEVVTVSEVDWTLLEATDLGAEIPATSEYLDPCVSQSGRFIYVKVKVKNNGSEMKSTVGLNLLDSQKREFISSSDIFSCFDDALFILDNLNPGVELTFIEVYEVPIDATGLRLEVTDLAFLGDEKDYIDLGL